jgi:hypothetical protein
MGQQRSAADVWLYRPDTDRDWCHLQDCPVIDPDGTPVAYLPYKGHLYGTPTRMLGGGWRYIRLAPCVDPGDMAAAANRWYETPNTPDYVEAMLANPNVRWLYQLLGHVSGMEEGRAVMAFGLAKGLVGIRAEVGDGLFDEDRALFMFAWQLGRQIGEVVTWDLAPDDWVYDESPEDWLSKWRAALAKKGGD